MQLAVVVAAWQEIAGTRSRRAKRDAIASLLRGAAPEEARLVVSYLSGVLPQGTVGLGWRSLQDLPGAAAAPTLSVGDVDAALSRIAGSAGVGSKGARRAELHRLFGRATDDERRFLSALIVGELRQGALAGVMVDAVAAAAGVSATDVRRAAMLAGDLGTVAVAVLGDRNALRDFNLKLMRPLQPMLAHSADDVEGALAKTGRASVEWKLDGARVQIHVARDDVGIFTRNLADVTDRVPEVVEKVRAWQIDAGIFDGEVIALHEDLRPRPFQVTMSRFGSSRGVDDLRTEIPLSLFVFDCLHLNGGDLIDAPLEERTSALAKALPQEVAVPGVVTTEVDEARAVLEEALRRGHEGVVVKAIGAPYEAGRRGAAWIKVKPAKTLDLVILAAEWGHGRRQGWLSNLHLGARDPDTGGFVMLGKTFKGMTDDMLAWQTEQLLQLETERDGIVVRVRPELVVEVAFDGLQTSTRYPAGLALRFARIKGYRTDKRAEDADTIETVRALHTGA
ncbi:MAG TPA: ATP-dependent DNA ligase [Actinomycetota bacterium]|nr:ATP-dependent DNA ligase [Actinomycetota bacterium]